jgi:hypothetical protein
MLDNSDYKQTLRIRDFGGLEVACWLLIPKFAGSNPAEAVLGGEVKACPISQFCGM